MKFNFYKKLNYLSVTTLMLVTMFFNFSEVNQAQSNTNQLKTKRILYFGLRLNSPPISYKNGVGGWEGFCFDFINAFQEQQKYSLIIVQKQVTLNNRFSGRGDDNTPLDAECGPDTLGSTNAKKIHNGNFSMPFTKTSAKFLIKQENKKIFDNKNLDNKQIGIYGGAGKTTTDNAIRAHYPALNNIVNLEPKYALEQLESGKIIAFASDELILKGILVQQSKEDPYIKEKYIIYPQDLSIEPYAMVIYSTETSKSINFLENVNSFLKTDSVQHLRSKYDLPDPDSKPQTELIENLVPFSTMGRNIFILFSTLSGVLLLIIFILVFKKKFHNIIELVHTQTINAPAMAISYEQLAKKHPDAKLQIVSMRSQSEGKFLIHIKTALNVKKHELCQEYFKTYNHLKNTDIRELEALISEKNHPIINNLEKLGESKQELQALISEKNHRITNLEKQIEMALAHPNVVVYLQNNVEQGGFMTNNSGGFSVGGSVGGNVHNVQGKNIRAVQGDNNQDVLGDNNQVTQKNQVGADASLTKDDVVKLLAELEALVKTAELPADTKDEVIEDLSAAKKATDKEEPNKNRALERLTSVADTLEKTTKTVESSQKIWTTAKPIIVKVAAWLGAAAGSHLLGL